MKLELMSPAGSLESIYAAARSGADAVYFGGGDFNARRNAKNLTNEELETAIKYLKLRGKKSYITVNTLLTDRELRELVPFLKFLNDAGASAVIIQDLAVAKIVKSAFPDLPMHASTQLTVHDLAGVKAMERLGFSRVVLSRELPASEIKFITENSSIETEIFCHGALCMCYSGQCYFSAAIGGRSGNRGLCAQPCRMQYSFHGEAAGPHLSLKDLCLAPHLQEIAQCGVTCVKIEGRMKRPEYTAYVTNVYRRAIDSGTSPSREEMDKLALLFSRDGFTDGYFTDKKGTHMFGTREEGDGKALRTLYKEAAQLYNGEEQPFLPIMMNFSAKAGEKMRLSCHTREGQVYECYGVVPEKANFRPTGMEEVKKSLEKTGGTVFSIDEINVDMDLGLKISISSVNSMRRQCLDALTAQRKQSVPRRSLEWNWGYSRSNSPVEPQYIFSVLKTNQVSDELLKLGPKWLYVPMEELHANRGFYKKIVEKNILVAAVLPRVIFDREWPALLAQLKEINEMGATGVVCTNVGHSTLLEKIGMELRGDFGLNVFNSQGMKQYKTLGLTCQTLSFELNFAQIRDISKCTDTELIVYGRLPLMITESCAIKNRNGNVCTCKSEGNAILDKTGRSFPIMGDKNCRNTIYNSDKLFLADKKNQYVGLGITYARLNFTTENQKECLQVAQSYVEKCAYIPERITRGLYARGVE